MALCEDLIIAQRPPRELPSVNREWRRLADPDTRDRLAESLERIARIAEDPGDPPTAAPYFDLRVAHAVNDELRELAALVRARSSGVAGVALVERLLSTATSPLHGEDERALREQLARVRLRFVNGP